MRAGRASITSGFVLAICLGVSASSLAEDTPEAIYKRVKSAIVKVETDGGVGTGFVVSGGDLILTCNHVVKGANRIVINPGNRAATIVATDEDADVAILRPSQKYAKSLDVSGEKTPVPGQKIYVIGNPLGFLDSTFTDGVVGGLRKVGDAAFLQISAQISPGSSGSPVLNTSGKVVGMVRSAMVGEGIQGLNFAVSSWNLRRALASSLSSLYGDLFAGEPRKKLGKLGQARTSTDIFTKPDFASGIYYRVETNQYLIVEQMKGSNWMKVLMSNGKFGFARKDAVVILPYEIVQNGPGKDRKLLSDHD